MTDLVSALEREAEVAEDAWERLRKHQRHALDYYEGQRLGNEQVGRSQIVLPDVQETCDYMAISVLRPFVSAGRIAEFEAPDEDSEMAAKEATAVVHYLFERKQDGFRVLHDFTVDGLRERVGILETMCITEEKVITEQYQIADPFELEQLGEYEVEAQEQLPDGTTLVTVKRTISEKRYIDEGVPTEEFRFSPNAQHEDTADYIARLCIVTRSDLVNMGFDKEQAYSVKGNDYDFRNDRVTSDKFDDQQYDIPSQNESSKALEKVLLRKEYVRFDEDGDGIAERIEVFRVEKDILLRDGKEAKEVVEEQPFVVFSPFPRPHRLVGYGLADKVMDLQLLRTTIARQLIDGMYLANMPRPLVDMAGANENTIGDLLSPIPGSPIRYKGVAPQPYQTSFDVGKSLTVLEWASGERESRTGITRLNQGLDADAMNKTATGMAMQSASGEQHEEFIARVLANCLTRLFAKKYRLLKREGAKFKLKVDGQYKDIDCAAWPDDVTLNVMVGLGTGNKDKRIQARMMLVPLMAEGLPQGLVEPRHTFKMIDGLVRDLGIGQGDDYWVDPDAPPEVDEMTGQPKQKQEKPDPEMAKVQAEQQMQQAKMQAEQEMASAKLQGEQQAMTAKLEMLREENQMKLQLQREQAEQEADLAERKAQFEATQAEAKMQQEFALAQQRMEMERQLAVHSASLAEQATLSKNRQGGALDK